MKLIRIIIGILFLQITLSAQVLQWTPQFATDLDSIVIIYDATQGNGALASIGPPIYAHTGVITNLSTGPGDWKYVKTQWTQNLPENTMQFLGGGKWKISFRIRSYYGVPTGEQILKLAFVFRNATGSIVGREADGSDIFLPLSQAGLNVAITLPSERPLLSVIGDTITVSAVSIQSSHLALYLDNVLIGQTTSTSLTTKIPVISTGKKYVKAVATGSGNETKADSFYFIVRPPLTLEALPAGVVDGINYISDNSVILSMYAPEKDFVYVIGDFNNWELDPNFYMKSTPDRLRYWIQIDNLTAQQEYRYQFNVNNQIKVADWYAEKILDPWNDPYISSTTYPNLTPYPTGKTTNIVSVLKTAETPYQWQTVNYQRPAKQDLIIYELLIRDFSTRHDYQFLMDTLSYLKSLGVNAIELMPVNEFEGNESWGYNPMFYFAADKYYGPKNELKKFIDTCHQNGIAVILDMVLNHSFGNSPMVRLYWDAVNNRPAANSPWFNPIPKHPYNVGYDFNHESQATKDFVDRVNKYWLTEFKVDGYRYDLSKGFTQVNSGDNVGLWGQYDQSRINILKRMADKVWQTDANAYVILEHFADNSEEKILADYGMMLWGNLNHSYNEATMGYPSDFSWGSYKARGWQYPNLITYMESHDEERLMVKNILYGNSSGGYSIKNINTSLNRIKLASAFLYTIPGAKMLWQFGELGYDVSIDFDCRVCNKPILWNYYNDINRFNLYRTKAAILKIRNENEAFRSSNYSLDVSGMIKKINIYHSSMDVVIVGNFDVIQRAINPNFSRIGYWYDYFSGDSVNISNTQEQLTLQPGEFNIYTTKKLPTPPSGILLDSENSDEDIFVQDFALMQNYPNPFNPSTNIKFDVAESGIVTLKVYDLLGKEVATLINEYKPSGKYEVTFNSRGNGANISTGVYFYQLKVNSFVETRKMILIQ
jgi:1,4-alpha-glucan branching enzyme